MEKRYVFFDRGRGCAMGCVTLIVTFGIAVACRLAEVGLLASIAIAAPVAGLLAMASLRVDRA